MNIQISYLNYFRKNSLKIILALVFIAQFLFIIYFNLACLENHLGYDSSWTYLRAILMWKEHNLFSSSFSEQTNIFLDSSMPLASLLYGMIGNVFIAYGISNIIIICLILFVLRSILIQCNLSCAIRLIGYNLFLCPYLFNGFSISNDLGYFSNILCGPAFYAVRLLLVLLIINNLLDAILFKFNRLKLFSTFILSFIAGISSGIFIILIVMMPYLTYVIEKALWKNDFKIFLKRDALFVYLCILFTLAGKLTSQFLLSLNTIDSSRTWTSIDNIWKNIGAVIQGLMKLINVLPLYSNTNESILSIMGIMRLFVLYTFFVLIVSLIYHCIKIKNYFLSQWEPILIFLNIVGINFIIFSLFNVQYGSYIFEERYLICAYVIIIILLCLFIESIDKKQIIRKSIEVTLTISIIGMNCQSNYIYATTTNASWSLDTICNYINQFNDAKLVYIWGDELIPMGRSLRVKDLTRIYKCIDSNGDYHHWGDYLYYEDPGEYMGETLLITTTSQKYIPSYIIEQYELVVSLNDYNIYLSHSNPIDPTSGIARYFRSIDYPYTKGILTENGKFENNGTFISDGKEGFIMWGPYAETKDGIYDFTLYYDIITSKGEGFFDIAVDSDSIVKLPLTSNEHQVTVSNIKLHSGHQLEYRVYSEKGCKIRIYKIEILKKAQ